MSGPVVAREPGRELDQEIAVRVMGWEARDEYYPSDGEYAGRLIYDHKSLPDGCRGGPGEGWSPSTRIAQAWEVVEKMSTLGWAMGMDMQGPPGAMTYDVGFWNGREWFSDEADTAPLAICRAALETLAHPTAAVPHSASPSSTEPAE